MAIDNHHFTPQTTEAFSDKILKSKCIKCYDIENIDYTYIENLYNTKIPEIVLNKKQGHERNNSNLSLDKPVYDLNIEEYNSYSINNKYFYNTELKKKIYKFYENDFLFYLNFGIDYNKECKS